MMRIKEQEGSQLKLRIGDQFSAETQERIDIYLDNTLSSGEEIPKASFQRLMDLGIRSTKINWTLAKYGIVVPSYFWMREKVA